MTQQATFKRNIKYPALLNGYEVLAENINGTWFAGGSQVEAAQNVCVLLPLKGQARRGWFKITGIALKFSDFEEQNELPVEETVSYSKVVTEHGEQFGDIEIHSKTQGTEVLEVKYKFAANGACAGTSGVGQEGPLRTKMEAAEMDAKAFEIEYMA